MSDRKLIDQLIDATLPRINALTTRTFEHATKEVNALDAIGSALGRPPPNDPLLLPSPELLRSLWSAALSDTAVSLLWGVADRAQNGEFMCTSQAIAAVVDGIDRNELARETGVAADDLRFVLREMGEALHQLTAKSTVEVMIDRRSITLRGSR